MNSYDWERAGRRGLALSLSLKKRRQGLSPGEYRGGEIVAVLATRNDWNDPGNHAPRRGVSGGWTRPAWWDYRRVFRVLGRNPYKADGVRYAPRHVVGARVYWNGLGADREIRFWVGGVVPDRETYDWDVARSFGAVGGWERWPGDKTRFDWWREMGEAERVFWPEERFRRLSSRGIYPAQPGDFEAVMGWCDWMLQFGECPVVTMAPPVSEGPNAFLDEAGLIASPFKAVGPDCWQGVMAFCGRFPVRVKRTPSGYKASFGGRRTDKLRRAEACLSKKLDSFLSQKAWPSYRLWLVGFVKRASVAGLMVDPVPMGRHDNRYRDRLLIHTPEGDCVMGVDFARRRVCFLSGQPPAFLLVKSVLEAV